MDNIDEVWLSFCSAKLSTFTNQSVWINFLTSVESCLGAKLVRLDENDPVRRKVTNIQDTAAYICTFRESEDDRWLHGKFDPGRISLGIGIFKQDTFANDVSFYFPYKFLKKDTGVSTIIDLFKIGNHYLKPFYTYCDSVGQIASKRKSNRHSVNLQSELGGIFWLTFLNRTYVDFFGRNKFENLPVISDDENGIAIKLGDSPLSSDFVVSRKEAEKILGSESFVDPTSEAYKPPGKYVLTFEQLREK